ncbi:MAG: aminoacyl-tRNA hydrolase [Proteobacteria bacterium]|nr:MAG: aminoacyl-tRNA hydrolase [Pseudomonadota bacterium]
MRLVVGLGNPGPEYEATRHNVGFLVVERLAARHGIALAPAKRLFGRFGVGRIAGVETGVLEPLTFMNRSGRSVCAAIDAHPLDPASELVVVYDDLDLPFGRLRLRPSGGAGGHNGLADIQQSLGRSDFARLRFGIGRPAPGVDPVDHVLAPFTADEAARLAPDLERAADAIEAVLAEGVGAAMNRFNRDPSPATT